MSDKRHAGHTPQSALLLTYKQQRNVQHKCKGHHRGSTWGDLHRLPLSHSAVGVASSTSAQCFRAMSSCTSQRGRVSRARKALNRCDAQVQGLTCLRFGRGEPWCCISLRHRRKQTSWRALIPKKEKAVHSTAPLLHFFSRAVFVFLLPLYIVAFVQRAKRSGPCATCRVRVRAVACAPGAKQNEGSEHRGAADNRHANTKSIKDD